jgi:hypothetical protein
MINHDILPTRFAEDPPRLTVKKILNHVEQEITAVYDRHSYDPEKREALESWAKRLMKIVSEVPAEHKSAA